MPRALAAVVVVVLAAGCLSVPEGRVGADATPGVVGDGDAGGGGTDAGGGAGDAQPPGACPTPLSSLVDEFASLASWETVVTGACSIAVNNGLLQITNDSNDSDGDAACAVRSLAQYDGAAGEIVALLGVLSGDAVLALRWDDGFAVVLHYDGTTTAIQTCTNDVCGLPVSGPDLSAGEVLRLTYGGGTIEAAVAGANGEVVVDTIVRGTAGCVEALLGVGPAGQVAWDAVNSSGGD